MGLFLPFWKGKDESKAIARIERCRNQRLLKRIAAKSPTLARRIAAIKGLEDPEDRIKAAFYNVPTELLHTFQDRLDWGNGQGFVIEQINDTKTLYRIAETSLQGSAPYALVRQLVKLGCRPEALATDRKLNLFVREAAVNLVDAQETLTTLAKRFDNPKERPLCVAAFRRITLPEVRKVYCRTYNAHDWVLTRRTSEQYGDTRSITREYTCKYCQETREEDETYKF
jgi:hypothetical protein